MKLAAEMLEFFQPTEFGGPRSIFEFNEHYKLVGEDARDAERIAHALVRELLLLPRYDPPSSRYWVPSPTYWSLYRPDEWEAEYGTYDFLTRGFIFVRSHFADSILALIVRTKDGDETNGTAFAISKNHLLTARHCLDDSISVRISNVDVSLLKAIKTPSDANKDIALLTFEGDPLPQRNPFRFGVASVLDQVMVTGYPRITGFAPVLVAEEASIAGYLQSTTGQIIAEATSYLDKQNYLLISARVKGGNSGGPVINRKGEAVGLITGDLEASGKADWLGFAAAIPSSEIQEFLKKVEVNNADVQDLKFQVENDQIYLK